MICYYIIPKAKHITWIDCFYNSMELEHNFLSNKYDNNSTKSKNTSSKFKTKLRNLVHNFHYIYKKKVDIKRETEKAYRRKGREEQRPKITGETI